MMGRQIERQSKEVGFSGAAGIVSAEVVAHPARRWRARLFQGYLLAAVGLFLILAFMAHSAAYFPIDLAITRALQQYHWIWLVSLMRLVSWPGYGPQVLLVTGAISFLVWTLGLRREAAACLLVGASSLALNQLLKLAVARPRPSADLVQILRANSDFSFPSGHVMFYTAFFGFLAFLSFTLLRASWKRWLLLILLGGLVVLVGPSRIYLGNHWASDVLGAYLIGSLLLAAFIWLYRRDPAG